MKRYETYKDSGIQWVGEIPSHWDVVKTSYLFDDIGSGTTPNTNDDSLYDTDNGINWLQTGDMNDGHITKTSKKISQKAIEGNGTLRLYPINSLVIALYGATIGKVGVLDIESTTNQACCVLPPSDKISTDFAYYIFLASKEALLNLASGGGQPNISQAIIKNHRIPYPSYAEQQSIASFLEDKVGQIDAAIAEKEQMLEDLKAYRSAIISEAVTKGLDKNVEMKDSGIEWLGMIPKHWNINKLKFFADISTGTTPSTDNEEYWKEPTENWYTPSDFCEENVHLETSSRKVSTTAFQESACRVFKKDVVLVVGIGATLGKIGISSVECSANQQINAIEFYDNVYPLFGAYYLSSLKEVMKSLASAATLAIMNQSVTGSIPFVCPTLDEQKEIADYLEKKTKSIGSLLNQIEVQIDELKSYKSVLITEAVTGKIDLREWKPKEENV